MRDDVTCTIYRKSMVSIMHEEHPELKSKLATLMCHREATASTCYRLMDREKTSVTAATKVRQVMSTIPVVVPACNVVAANSSEAVLPTEIDTLDSLSSTSEIIPPVNFRKVMNAFSQMMTNTF